MAAFSFPAVILAGGDGRRLNAGVKPLVELRGQPLISHVIERIRPQVSHIAVAVRAPAAWAGEFTTDVLTDAVPDAGPLAGVAAALNWAKTPLVLTCTADAPFLPHDLAARLNAAMVPDIDVVVAASGRHCHFLTALWRTALAARVVDALRNGAISARVLLEAFRVADVVWPDAPHDPFFNINTPADLAAAEGISP